VTHRNSLSPTVCLALFFAAFCATFSFGQKALGASIVFDLPESIECRDVTPPEFAAHEYLKVIEGKLRISARVVEGTEGEIVDFMYTIACPDKRVRFQDYLPNTTLESAVAGDQIEIKDATERATTAGADVHVVYKLLALGGTLSQTSKNSEASCYRQIAPKELVVASGTTDREHGVFFRLRPSRAASLEGAKEFTFLATVPKSWRGDLATISCAARANKDSLFSTSIVPAGLRTTEVGLYLAGDAEAASLAEELRIAQESLAGVLAAGPPKENVFETISCQAAGLLGSKKKSESTWRKEFADAEQAVTDTRHGLRQLAH
jgi:hypothetical protein